MNLLDLVKSRYSCRNYQPTSVEQEKYDDGFHDDFNVSEELKIEYYD